MMLSARTVAAIFVWSVAGIVGSFLFLYGTPLLEARLAPVLTNQAVTVGPDDRKPGEVCWTWSWVKERYAQPVLAAWTIQVEGTTVEYPAVTQRQRDKEVIKDIRPVPLGPGRNDLCAAIPAELDDLSNLTIRGQVNYRMPHRLWTIWQDLPVVHVPPLKPSPATERN